MTEPKNELQRNAINEKRKNELEFYQRAMDIQWLNSRMEDGGMNRCLALIKREADLERDFQTRTDHAAIVNEKARKETALAQEIAKIEREEACTLLRRHQLRENDPELRTLMKKLHAGYVCRDLKLQIQNNEYKRLQEKAAERSANHILQTALRTDQEAALEEEKAKMEKNAAYCKEIQQQLVNRQLQKQCQYEDTLIEKKMLDDIVRTISDEDQRKLEKKRRERERLRGEMLSFKQAQDAWKEKHKKAIFVEEKKIEEQNEQASDRSAAIVAERERKVRERQKLNEIISAKILAEEAERQEREDIIRQLQEQEYLERNHIDDVTEKEKIERAKRETKAALMTQMEIRLKLEREQRERDIQLRMQVENNLQSDEAKERETQLKLKEKKKQYAQELLRQMSEKEEKKKKEKENEEARAKRELTFYNRSGEVEEERKRIIAEHAPRVLGYLQAGVLREGDLSAVKEGALKEGALATLDVDSMIPSAARARHPKCNDQCMVIRNY